MTIPVVVGVGEIIQRTSTAESAQGPIELMVEAARAAAADANAATLLTRVEWLAVVGGAWRYRSPGEVVASQLGARYAATALTGISGTAPQDAVGLAATRIAAGELDVALIVGGEARRTHRSLKRAGISPPWILRDGEREPERLTALSQDAEEEAIRLGGVAALYALMEDRIRFTAGRSVTEQRHHIATLWERFSAVAAKNPYAWDQQAWTAEQIASATPANRTVAFPYTKAMVANNDVDMGSAILLTSLETALAAGVPRDRLVFAHSVASAEDTALVARRETLNEAPGLVAAVRKGLGYAGIEVNDLTHIDLYACFPSIVQMSMAALGLGAERELTVTGGLGFAGAPLANAVGHSIATIVQRIRDDGGWGLVHANGGVATKHSIGVYAPHPPSNFRSVHVTSIDRRERDLLPPDWSGDVTVEAATAVFDRDGSGTVVAAVRNGERRRIVTSTDPSLIPAVTGEGLAGTPAALDVHSELKLH